MKKVFFILVSVLAISLSACGQAGETEAVPTVVLDAGASSQPVNNQPSSNSSVSASAIVVPVQAANLSFTSIGRVTEVNVQVGDKVKAGDVLVQLDTAVLEAKVREAEANLKYAEIQLDYLVRNAGCRFNCAPSQQHIEVAENDVAKAQALVDSAKAVLAAQSNLTAPFAGTVISVDISPYETVAPGQIVMVLGDLSNYRIETTDLSERDVPRVQVGQPTTVFIEALGSEFTGKVTDVARISSEIGGDIVYKVTIELDEQPAGLLWGMSADVDISVGE
ncbi:MAG: efflux RND transporter periplasmic adaptor subunit [Anaerolineales bacterium]|uniref:efflux RND transporter periplasmic adaptor subunit n=1 Tax=Candidatus Villigracilis vicinus TaxID=3140679 RepID=UPI0031367862|nr:efflux RND transporter periplasmic adaptor subunit [Anaerolineales bacterium]MBK7451294.1 efflux RND transporter periplasmic adaptor subunit [Anaerolineales bacterium]MBK9779529.1 efflux RND transporter periplasmic adaptor subunit [Anaerolineales bacterium]